MRAFMIFISLLFLAGCASSNDVHQVGSDTYMISSSAITSFGGAGAAKGRALGAADDFCSKRGQRMELVDQQSSSSFTSGNADITFRCQ